MPSTRPVASGDGEEEAAMAVSEAEAVGSSALELSIKNHEADVASIRTHKQFLYEEWPFGQSM